jgi:hypothetical protein
VIFNGVFQFTNAGFELFLVLDNAFQLGWDGVDQIADAGDGATGKEYDETRGGFLLYAPPKTSVRRGLAHRREMLYLYFMRWSTTPYLARASFSCRDLAGCVDLGLAEIFSVCLERAGRGQCQPWI